MLELVPSLASLGGTVVTVVLFLWYMNKRDIQSKEISESSHAAIDKNTETMAKNSETINRSIGKNTEVLSDLSMNLALQKEALKNVCRSGD